MPERSAAGYMPPVWCGAWLFPHTVHPRAHKADKMATIHEALEKCCAENSVFYQDEVSINCNPKIGSGWQVLRQQKHVMTIGQNEKDYLAGHCTMVQAKSVTWVEAAKTQPYVSVY